MALNYVMTLQGPTQKPGFFKRLFGLRGPHGGGGHHGGGHGGGHHGGGGWNRGGGWGPDYYSGDTIIVNQTCPDVHAPVLAADGQVYNNACYATMAGTTVVKTLGTGMSGPVDTLKAHPILLGLGLVGGVLLGMHALKRRRR